MSIPKYLNTITLGNILTIISMLGTIVGLYVAHDRRITVLESDRKYMSATIQHLSTTQDDTSKKIERLLVLSERRGKTGN